MNTEAKSPKTKAGVFPFAVVLCSSLLAMAFALYCRLSFSFYFTDSRLDGLSADQRQGLAAAIDSAFTEHFIALLLLSIVSVASTAHLWRRLRRG